MEAGVGVETVVAEVVFFPSFWVLVEAALLLEEEALVFDRFLL